MNRRVQLPSMPTKKEKSVILPVLRWLIFCLPILFIALLVNDHWLLTPTVRFTYLPGRYVTIVRPKALTDFVRTADSEVPWRMFTDSLRFTVRLPRVIQGIKIRLNILPKTQPFVSFSAIGQEGIKLTTIIYSDFLNKLVWHRETDGEYSIWSKTTPAESNISSLLTNVHIDTTKIGVVDLDPMFFSQPSLKSAEDGKSILLAKGIRGGHILYSNVHDKGMSFSFLKRDLNRIQGADSLTVLVGAVSELNADSKNWNKIIHVKDDGDIGSVGVVGTVQPVHISLPDLPSGVYRIEIQAGDDILMTDVTTTNIETNFYSHLYLASGPNYKTTFGIPSQFIVTGKNFQFRTIHSEGQQKIQLDGNTFLLTSTNLTTLKSIPNQVGQLTIPNPDIYIGGTGLFAPFGTRLLPLPAREVSFSGNNPDITGLEYLVVKYIPPTSQIRSFEKEYSIQQLGLSTNDINFQIDAPGLVANNNVVGLESISATLVRGEFPWGRISTKLRAILHL